MAGEPKAKRYDPMAPRMAALIAGRPWLGWRHRRPMPDYTRARRRNALLQAVGNSGMVVYNLASGKFIVVPFIAFFTAMLGRSYLQITKDPSGFEADWMEIREALERADRERAQGIGRRRPSPLSMVVVAVAGFVTGAQFGFALPGGWPFWIGVGVVLAMAGVAADVALHVRFAPTATSTGVSARVAAAVAPSWDGLFPIADYDDLVVSQILPLLPRLYADELPLVAARERAGKSRRTVLQRIARLEALLADAPDDLTAEEWLAMTGGRVTPRPAPQTPAVAAVPA